MKYLLLFLVSLTNIYILNASEHLVTNTNNDGEGSLRELVALANEGDTVKFDSDLLNNGSDTVVLQSKIQFSKSLTIKGLYNNSDTLYISGNDLVNIFSISVAENVYLDSLNIIDGYQASSGGCIVLWSSDSLFISNSTIKNCYSESDGGGLYIHNSKALILENTKVINNVSDQNGGGIYINCLFNHGNLIARNTIIANNVSGWDGGGIGSLSYYAYNTNITIENSEVSNNAAANYGGGVFSASSNDYTSSSIQILESIISSNSCGFKGGGVFSAAPTSEVTIASSTFESNTSSSDGAAIYSSSMYLQSGLTASLSSISIEASTFSNNSASIGSVVLSRASALYSSRACTSNVSINTSTFYANSSGFLGGLIESGSGMSNGSVSLDVQNSTIVNNTMEETGMGALTVLISYDNIPVFKIGNTILAFNGRNILNNEDNVETIFQSLGYNIFSDSVLTDTIFSDQINIDSVALNLSELAFNGGPTQTMLPIYPSVAIESGNPLDMSPAQNAVITGIREVGAAESCLVTKVDSVFSCEPYTWIDGISYSSSTGQPVMALQNTLGCDSIVSLNLIIPDTIVSYIDSISACDSYTWIDGINYTESIDSAYITYSNVDGCDSTIYLYLDLNYSSYRIDSIEAYETYTWIDGVTYTSSNDTSFYVLINASGCDSITSLNLNILQVNTEVNVSGITISSLADSAQYQWVDCNADFAEIEGETNQNFTPIENGSYAVVVTEGNVSDTSACILINSVGVDDFQFYEEVIVYPNPTNGIINVDLGSNTNVGLKIYSLAGKLIHSETDLNGLYQVDLTCESGVYILEFTIQVEKQRIKLIKN